MNKDQYLIEVLDALNWCINEIKRVRKIEDAWLAAINPYSIDMTDIVIKDPTQAVKVMLENPRPGSNGWEKWQ